MLFDIIFAVYPMTLLAFSMKQFFTFLFFLFSLNLSAQNLQRLDSLQTAFEKASTDNYAQILRLIAQEQHALSFGNALKFAQKCVNIAKKSAIKESLPLAYRNLAELYIQQGEVGEAINYFFEALQTADRLGLRTEVANIITRLSEVYDEQGNTVMALEYLLSAAEIYEEIGLKRLAFQKYQRIGEAHFEGEGYENAIFYFKRAIQIAQDSLKKKEKIVLYHFIGLSYQAQKKYDKANIAFYAALGLAQKINDENWIGSINGSLGILQKQQGNLSVAVRFLKVDLDMSQKRQDWRRAVDLMNSFGQIYTELGSYHLAKHYYDSALTISEKHKLYEPLMEVYKGLAAVCVLEKEFEEAYYYQEKFVQIVDSLNKQKIASELNKVQSAYNMQKKQAQIEILMKNNQIHEETIKKQSLITSLIAIGLASLSLIIFVLLQSNRNKKRLNNQLQKQKNEIESQRDEIEEKSVELSQAIDIIHQNNKRLMDSINYAKHIQVSMLPDSETLSRAFPENFIFFKPRDIVSGDFYWFHTQNHRSILAAIDCTGHGVPGAFISMIANELLNEIIILRTIYEPNLVLSELHKSLKITLRQNQTENRDGMDISLCVVHQVPEGQEEWFGKPRLEFAGANNPLIYIQNQTLFEIKADKKGIGGKQSQDELNFEAHTVFLDQNTTFYIFSDGYHDQLGGQYGRKYLSRRFKEVLLANHEKSMDEQKEFLEKNIQQWQAVHHEKQTDDMLIIGFRYKK